MANPDAPAIVSLRPTLQNYSWGRIGHESLVAKLAKSCFSTLSYQSNGEKDKVTRTSNVVAERSIQNEEGIGNFQISPDLPYAELWMGMHPRGTSVVYSPQEPKTHHLQLDKYLAAVKAKIAPIPYLLKVLSVAKPLSIQAHPDAKKAKELFETNPDVYSDPNAKPEMTIALGYLELLCGFRKLFEIAFFIENIPELQRILGEATMKSLGITITQLSGEFVKECFSSTHDPSVLKSLFTSLLQCPNSIVQTELNHLMNRLNLLRDSNTIPQMDSRVYDACKLAQRLHSHFPGDVGVFCAFFLNFLRLEDGCGIFISANKLHAYIAG
ncbi:CHORD protein [Cardiosporidium cionae]|uniref:CHORD protein n=1 Tax=Cardiosporidium cionae TaxID=476202 RepID=A0ABQ7JAE3_9APIC|nr:CHORD protein [Cardiosporidium cionae]|eukprot:KAF8820951.1 CHORD protein [Cardiosporidium cionae]